MSKAVLVARLFLGLVFVVFGLNGFLNFIPIPPIDDPRALAFMTGLGGTGYFFPFLKITEIICGLAFLAGRFVPLAAIISAPIVINIALYHRLLAGGPPMDLAMVAALALIGYGYRENFQGILKAK